MLTHHKEGYEESQQGDCQSHEDPDAEAQDDGQKGHYGARESQRAPGHVEVVEVQTKQGKSKHLVK